MRWINITRAEFTGVKMIVTLSLLFSAFVYYFNIIMRGN
jgi:hypothetical protein